MDNLDIFVSYPNRNPAKRIRFGSEEQQNERGMRFLCGAQKSRRKRYDACDELAVVIGFEPPPAKPLRRKGFAVFINVKSPILEPTFHEPLHSFIQ